MNTTAKDPQVERLAMALFVDQVHIITGGDMTALEVRGAWKRLRAPDQREYRERAATVLRTVRVLGEERRETGVPKGTQWRPR